jgi:hypothetical protein
MHYLSACAVFLLVAQPCRSQDTVTAAQLTALEHVRVNAPSVSPAMIHGRVVALGPSALVVASTDSSIRIARTDVVMLERRERMSRKRSALLWGTMGAFASVAVVSISLSLAYEYNDGNDAAILFGFPAGLVTGAVLGAMYRRTRWVEVNVREWSP